MRLLKLRKWWRFLLDFLYNDKNRSARTPQNLAYSKRRKRAIWKLAKKWIKNCYHEHGHQCNISLAIGEAKFFPTRVIDVSSNVLRANSVRIVERENVTNINSARYTALTYCWGRSMPELAKTTLATLQAHKQNLSLELLPQTIRDAIEITRNLDISYLWIDALCIIQDSAKDLEQEIAVMGKVYSFSHVTIAAAISDHSDGGCLPSQVRKSKSEPEILVAYDRNPWCQIAMSKYLWSEWSRSYANNPLIRRAWCMQERELSPRVIHFTASQVLWECRMSRHSEKSPFKKSEQRKLREISLRSLDSIWGMKPASSEPENVQVRWAQIVQRYSSMSLTHVEDRLHALSGLAETFQKRYIPHSENSNYLGGIWADHLPESLLWYAQPEQVSYEDDRNPTEKAYLPSWSWISVKDPVFHASPSTSFKPFIEVVRTKVTPISSSNPFGNLSSGCIVLRGWAKSRAELLSTQVVTIQSLSGSFLSHLASRTLA